MQFEKQASVHEKTLETISVRPVNEFVVQRKTRKSKINGPLKAVKVDPRVWKVAMKLAKGNVKLLKVNSSESVTVLNNPKQS